MKRIALLSLVVIYVVSHLYRLNLLPIFADEAIYLRWATMIFHDPGQFLFLPLYDGKTPLFVWTLIPIVRTFTQDPLLGGRLWSVLLGLITALVLTRIVRLVKGSTRAEIITFLLATLLPMTFFFNRMSLIDVPLTLLLAITFLFGLHWMKSAKWKHALWTGFFWGLALLTKTSALYVLPIFLSIGLYKIGTSRFKNWRLYSLQFGLSGMLGLLMLVSLKVSPLFPFLFNRSSDFAFSIGEIVSNPIKIMLINIPRISMWLWWYMSPVLWIVTGLSLLFFGWKRESQKIIWGLFICGLMYISPFVISGKLLTSRYFLPAVIWFIPMFGLLVDYWLKRVKIVGIGMIAAILVYCGWFIFPLITNLDTTKLTADDKRQYLSEWSAGFGIEEIRLRLIEHVNLGKTILVGTEGYFGTLPDGLFIYFSETPWLSRMEIIGVGQPIINTPDELIQKAPRYDETYLVVNQNRIKYDYSPIFEVIDSYPKPHDGSPLLLLRLKQ